MNHRTLTTGKLLSSSPSRNSALSNNFLDVGLLPYELVKLESVVPDAQYKRVYITMLFCLATSCEIISPPCTYFRNTHSPKWRISNPSGCASCGLGGQLDILTYLIVFFLRVGGYLTRIVHSGWASTMSDSQNNAIVEASLQCQGATQQTQDLVSELQI